jgi:transcriptional regulator with XRE-family HTH domain
MKNNFAEKLANLRAQKGLTQRQLGEMAGVAWSMISKYESGQSKPRLKVLMRLGDALGVSVKELQGEEESRPTVELYDGFSSRLLELRCRKKISLRLLAKRTGIDVSVLNEFEHGELSPSTDDLYDLAEALEVSVSELAGEKDEEETVRIKLAFDDSSDKSLTVAATPDSYQSLIDVAKKLGLTPGEVLGRYLEIAAEASRDPDNASEAALSLLESIKFK